MEEDRKAGKLAKPPIIKGPGREPRQPHARQLLVLALAEAIRREYPAAPAFGVLGLHQKSSRYELRTLGTWRLDHPSRPRSSVVRIHKAYAEFLKALSENPLNSN